MKILGIIFDMDGVLVDSEPVITQAAIKGLEEFGVQAKPDDFIPFVGAGEDRFIGGVANKYGVDFVPQMKKRVYEIYLELVDAHLEIYPKIPELLERLANKGYALALASSADRIKVTANLKTAKIPFERFSVILSGEDVTHKKPAPDIFQKAAQKLGIDPCACVVIEDAENGILAAKAAGMRAIGITSSFDADQLRKKGADATFESTLEIERWIEENG